MKKVFRLTDAKKHEDRVMEAIKHEIRKYIKREKKKEIPNKSLMYWDFDCKAGGTKESAEAIEYDNLFKALDAIKATGATEVYIEVMAKAVNKPPKPEATPKVEEQA